MGNEGSFIPSDVAAWMVSEFNRNQILFHDIAVLRIRDLFGTEFICEDTDGNFSIKQSVLLAFRAMTKDAVVWERRKRYWRKRTDDDMRGRNQDLFAKETSQKERDVSFFLTIYAGQYLCDQCISEFTGIKPPSKVGRYVKSPSSGYPRPAGQFLYCHRADNICARCRQKRMATAYISA